MGCAPSVDTQHDQSVATALNELEDQDRQLHKLLLLGTGNSGKTTIFKQLNQIHGQTFQSRDRAEGVDLIYTSILRQIQAILEKRSTFASQANEYEAKEYVLEAELEDSARYISKLAPYTEINEEVASHIASLWSSRAIKLTFENRDSLAIVDSCPYFFNDIQRIGDASYVPTDDDLLFLRSPTTGVTRAKFRVDGHTFEVYDVGGQKNERKKWIHVFDNVTAILWVSSLTCYDQSLFEDETVNAMEDALDQFEEIAAMKEFVKTPIILFLNKVDLFKKKIQTVGLDKCWKEYRKPADETEQGEVDDAIQYIYSQFAERYEDAPGDRHLIYQVTCGIDANNIERVFTAVKQVVIERSLASSGLV